MNIGQTAPRTVTTGLRQRAWWVIRRHGVFTLPELLATVADGKERAAASNLGRYLRALERTGILKQEGRSRPTAPTSNGSIRYRLARDLGREAPVWRQSARQVYDPNSGELYAIA